MTLDLVCGKRARRSWAEEPPRVVYAVALVIHIIETIVETIGMSRVLFAVRAVFWYLIRFQLKRFVFFNFAKGLYLLSTHMVRFCRGSTFSGVKCFLSEGGP